MRLGQFTNCAFCRALTGGLQLHVLETEAEEILSLIRARKNRQALTNKFTADDSVPTPGGGENRRTAKSPVDEEQNVERKVKGLLNKLTREKFDSISDQVITWASVSETENDGRTLNHVVRLIFEHATDEAAWSEIYARLCRKMMDRISSNVKDDGIRNADGKPMAGGQLFRKYLSNRCQQEFERGWAMKGTVAAKTFEDAAVKKSAEAPGGTGFDFGKHYAARKAKRRGLGLIQFIGELYKLRMLTSSIIDDFVKRLLGKVKNPGEKRMESLHRLLTTVGRILDNPGAYARMDVHFRRMKELGKSSHVPPRLQFMLQVSSTVSVPPIIYLYSFLRILSSCVNASGFQGIKVWPRQCCSSH